MSRILVTGSTTGLGLGAAEELLDNGHRVVLHARTASRAAELGAVAHRAEATVFGDLADRAATVELAEQVNDLGGFDAVIHNAGVYVDAEPMRTAEGHPRVVAVNVIAPYLLTTLIDRPARLVYVTSGMHESGRAGLDDVDWTTRRWNGTQAYCDSKLLVSTLSAAVARRWPNVRSNAVDPGWVPTRMGGPNAPDDLVLGHRTQAWLATTDDNAADATGGHWFHQQRHDPAPAVNDLGFQDELIAWLESTTGVRLPAG